MAIPTNAISPDELDKMVEEIEADGKIALFNPPPFAPYHCPICNSKLVE